MLQKCNGVKISELDSRKSFTGSEYVVVADNEENYKIPIEQISDVVVDSSKFKAVVENVYTSSKPVADVTLDKGTFKFTFGIPPGEKGKDGKDGKNGKDGTDGKDGIPGVDGIDGDTTRTVVAYKSTKTTTTPEPPIGGSWNYITNEIIYPSGWSGINSNINGYLWQSSAVFSSNGALLMNWDGPFRLTGDKGADGVDGNDGVSTGSPLRMAGDWGSGVEYFDGRLSAENGFFYQDVVIYNDTYYICIDSTSGNNDNWAKNPEEALYFSKITLTPSQISNVLIANNAFIKELSTNEVTIFDNQTIVAGMTSNKPVSDDSKLNGIINNKGDVRIWAGKIQVDGDLTSAPFTVTDQGVVKSQGKNGTIILKDGTIYFIVNNVEYRLGITDGKPDWIDDSAVGSTAVQFYQLDQSISDNSVVSTGGVSNLRYFSDGKYYNDSTLTTLANGIMYQFVSSSSSPILLNNAYKLVSSSGKIGGEEIYRKVTFNNGVMTINGVVAIMYSMSLDGTPTVNKSVVITRNTAKKVWCSFEANSSDSTGIDNFIEGAVSSNGTAVAKLIDSENISFGVQATKDLFYYILKPSSIEDVNTNFKYTDYSMNLTVQGYTTFKLENQSVV